MTNQDQNTTEKYSIQFSVRGVSNDESIDISIDGVINVDEAILKMNEVLDAKNAILKSISETTKDVPDDVLYFLFVKGDISSNQQVNVFAKNVDEAIIKYKRISGLDNLKLRQVSMMDHGKGNAAFELSRVTTNEDGSEEYVMATIYAKDLESAFKKVEEITGLKGFTVRFIYKRVE